MTQIAFTLTKERFWFKRCCKLVFSLLYWESAFYYRIYAKRDNRKSKKLLSLFKKLKRIQPRVEGSRKTKMKNKKMTKSTHFEQHNLSKRR